MVVPNYTYLKLKMRGPRGVVIIGTSFQCTYECEVECYELTTASIASRSLQSSGGDRRGSTQLQAVGQVF
jgi:hypothetical protein